MRKLLAIAMLGASLCVGGQAMAVDVPPASADTPQLKIVWQYLTDLRSEMRDPDSFIVEKLLAHFSNEGNKFYEICVQYRAKNGFGGYNREVHMRGGYMDSTTEDLSSTSDPTKFDPNALSKLITDKRKPMDFDDPDLWSKLCKTVEPIDPHTIGF